MASIVCVHGIGQQLKGEETLALEWRAALRDGMRRAGAARHELPPNDAIEVAYYGDLFRGRGKSDGAEPFELVDIDEGLEADLLTAWWSESERDEIESAEGGIDPLKTKSGWASRRVQSLAETLLRRRFFAALTNRLLVGALKQVRWYFTDSEVRQLARERLLLLVGSDTRLVVAHSLGSIVAYEALSRADPLIAPALITIGSPLGLPNLIFDRIDPKPVDGRGQWPGNTSSWTNIADRHDIVASVKRLAPLFGERVRDVLVDNEALAHDIGPYFTAGDTGKAVLEALRAV